jgi:hypothetical protein
MNIIFSFPLFSLAFLHSRHIHSLLFYFPFVLSLRNQIIV